MLRTLAAVFTALVVFSVPTVAQDTPLEAEWQAVITHQIQAFRDKDAAAAFEDAAPYFHAIFPNEVAFFQAIVGTGYAPIMESSGHSFGPFELDPGGAAAMQLVRLVGNDQQLYELVYNMTKETVGWRVSGVMMRDTQAVGI